MKLGNFRVITLACVSVGFSSAQTLLAYAGNDNGREKLLAILTTCMKEPSDNKRLVCFDTAMLSTPTLTATAKQPGSPAQARLDAALDTQAHFGLTTTQILTADHPAELPRKPYKSLEARVQLIDSRLDGTYQLTLDNGQVWRQIASDIRFTVDIGEVVLIKRGALGTYFLSTSHNRGTRVQRER